jgi:hypothetical protein
MAGIRSDQPESHKGVQGGGKCIVLRGRCESERDRTATEVFPHAEWVSREYGGVPVANLIEILRLEREFRRRILETDSPEERREQYRELCDRVHILKQQDVGVGEDPGSFDRLVLTFRKELEGVEAGFIPQEQPSTTGGDGSGTYGAYCLNSASGETSVTVTLSAGTGVLPDTRPAFLDAFSEHTGRVGIPASRVSAVRRLIDPTIAA